MTVLVICYAATTTTATTTCASASLVLKKIKTSTFPKSLSRLKSLLYCSSALVWLVRRSFSFFLYLFWAGTYRSVHSFDINVTTIFERIHFRMYTQTHTYGYYIHSWCWLLCSTHTAILLLSSSFFLPPFSQ